MKYLTTLLWIVAVLLLISSLLLAINLRNSKKYQPNKEGLPAEGSSSFSPCETHALAPLIVGDIDISNRIVKLLGSSVDGSKFISSVCESAKERLAPGHLLTPSLKLFKNDESDFAYIMYLPPLNFGVTSDKKVFLLSSFDLSISDYLGELR